MSKVKIDLKNAVETKVKRTGKNMFLLSEANFFGIKVLVKKRS